MFRVILQEIVERPGKRAITRECVRLDVADIGVLELVAAVEKIKAKKTPTNGRRPAMELEPGASTESAGAKS